MQLSKSDGSCNKAGNEGRVTPNAFPIAVTPRYARKFPATPLRHEGRSPRLTWGAVVVWH
ncbi:hypothetical protein H6G81_21520 [Scytonema hofmannii FACHB-248]|uniref:Uncharacterized protein n=1 Tax=Scytonema hofmannii FACHB-248 TaxID=1842502 RepID=A0ABR8GVE7_9CYAN|nr:MULTISPECIES: hypothetical protein [Nostocales]MBD2607036.1 hypothetical protein [Scytonema hofmannii FACHB-248]